MRSFLLNILLAVVIALGLAWSITTWQAVFRADNPQQKAGDITPIRFPSDPTFHSVTISSNNSSSSIQIGNSTSVGCIKAYNSAGTGIVYGTFTSSSFVVSSTKPNACL